MFLMPGTYEAGELVAEGIVDGKVVATHSVRTPEQPRQVQNLVEGREYTTCGGRIGYDSCLL